MFQDFSDLRDISEYVWDAKAEDTTRLYDCADEAIAALEKRPEKRRSDPVDLRRLGHNQSEGVFRFSDEEVARRWNNDLHNRPD